MIFATVGICIGLELLRTFYHDGQLSYGLTMLMILTTLVGSFMAFTGIILHAILQADRSIHEADVCHEEGKGPARAG